MFLDTSGLLCLIHVREKQHEKAVSSYDAATTPRLTHSYVLDEFIALALARKLSREAALDFSERLIDDANIETVWWMKCGIARLSRCCARDRTRDTLCATRSALDLCGNAA